MTEIEIPYGGWRPRPYQRKAWDYLKAGGRHAELIWHRRSGKDEIALHHAAKCMLLRPATYWHMLPMANQVRKAIWEAVNPHTGKRRIFEAFPREIFEPRETDMLIKCRANDSTWQCLGSDNYEGGIGSPPVGITYSEWAQANPSARGYLRPIIAENSGWQVFITTPRGKNHAHRTFKAAQKNPDAFAELLTVEDTGILTAAQLGEELHEYISTYGEDQGRALFEQEYYCSFDAAILGAYYGAEFARVDKEHRVCEVPYDESIPVHTAWDLGYDDDTAIWWYQVIRGEVHILEYYYSSGKTIEDYATIIRSKSYQYGNHWLPHDAKAKTLASGGKSILEQMAVLLGRGTLRLVANLSVQDGIQATRQMFPRVWFDQSCDDGIEALRQYQREWDDERKMFKDHPLHNWTSHPADAFRYLAIAWKAERQEVVPDTELKDLTNTKFQDLWPLDRPKARDRI